MSRIPILIFCLVFSLGFGAGGIAGWYMLIGEVRAALVPSSWQSVPAQVLSTDLKRFSGSKGGSTYRTDVNYAYTVQGVRYESQRVRLTGLSLAAKDTSSDNLGSFHQDLHALASSALAQEKTITAWYDPAEPAQAVLDRGMRWGMFFLSLPFAFLFSAVGLGAAWGAALALGGRFK